MKKSFFIIAIVAIAMLANVNLKAFNDADGDGWWDITTYNDLVTLANNQGYWNQNYELTAMINVPSGQNFSPIGTTGTQFTGSFRGKDPIDNIQYEIVGLVINQPNNENVGLFGVNTGLITNLIITNCRIVGNDYVGALVGYNDGVIENCSSSGYVEGYNSGYNIGGLVGYNTELVSLSFSSADISGGYNVGGLIGNNYITDASAKTIYKCYSSGLVTGLNYVGGLIGLNHGLAGGGAITGCIAYIDQCYSISNVFGNNYLGGLVGGAIDRSDILNSYAMGRVKSNSSYQGVGGFVGYANNNSYMTKCYSQGGVVPIGLNVGGFIGITDDAMKITYCHWDNVISGQTQSAAGISTDQEDMFDSGTFTNWDFVNIWDIDPSLNGEYPFLRDVTPVNNVLQPRDPDNDTLFNIANLKHLRWISEYYELGWSLNYELDNNIDASSTINWNRGEGFSPIGNASIPYVGHFLGNNYIIDGLYINRPNQDYIGLFGYIFKNVSIFDLRLTNCNITGDNNVGGIAGNVTNDGYEPLSLVALDNCMTTGSITGYQYVGGLAGRVDIGNGLVTGTYIRKSSSKCSVTGILNVGGLVGTNSGWIINCYSRGTVAGQYTTGGAFGSNEGSGIIEKCYSTGLVNTSASASGFIADNNGAPINDSFWDIVTSNKSLSDGGLGNTTNNMILPSTFVGWDFIDIWECTPLENDNYPSFLYVPLYKRNINNKEFNISLKNINVDIYPNPVSTEAKLTINLDKDIYANIYIYNTLGQIVKSCYSGEISQGTKDITLNLQDINEGTYYLIIENKGVLSCKMIVISR